MLRTRAVSKDVRGVDYLCGFIHMSLGTSLGCLRMSGRGMDLDHVPTVKDGDSGCEEYT